MPTTTSPRTTPTSRTTRTKQSNAALYAFDAEKCAAHGIVCGVDEAGRGPLCGPVCCAAVILDPDDPIKGVNDSKKLTEKRREALFEEITRRAAAYKIVFISPQEIDERNILWATMDGMAQAVAGLNPAPDYALIDGNRCPPGLSIPAEAVVKGDAASASIAAAWAPTRCAAAIPGFLNVAFLWSSLIIASSSSEAFTELTPILLTVIPYTSSQLSERISRSAFASSNVCPGSAL